MQIKSLSNERWLLKRRTAHSVIIWPLSWLQRPSRAPSLYNHFCALLILKALDKFDLPLCWQTFPLLPSFRLSHSLSPPKSSQKQDYASLRCQFCHRYQFCHSCIGHFWSSHWICSWKSHWCFSWQYCCHHPHPHQAFQKLTDQGGEERGKMLKLRKPMFTFDLKASPYLASRILGYHHPPWLPPIIIPAGPSRKSTWCGPFWMNSF